MTLRPPSPDDAADIQRIALGHGLPLAWTWPEGKHGIVVEHDGRVVAFCVLNESIYGLVTEELWEEQTRDGFRGLSLLSRHIESIAQRLADERGEPVLCGGVIRLERATHIAALRKRGYTEAATVMAKTFEPHLQP